MKKLTRLSAISAFVLLSLLPAGMSGCHNYEDCRLYQMCPGDLLTRAQENLAGEDVDACAICLDLNCKEDEPRCATDVECNYTSRCMLTRSPLDYQKCIEFLNEQGFTDGREHRRPWEGSTDDSGVVIARFGTCVHKQCNDECIASARFGLCGDARGDYEQLTLEIAVRMFPEYTPAAHVELRACRHDEPCDGPFHPTDQGGMLLKLTDIPAYVPVDKLYFEVRPTADSVVDFPPTLYYPGPLGSTGRQLLAIYLVSGKRIAQGNGKLDRGDQILKSRAQSVILPDSCVWEESSTPGLRVRVENAEVPHCYQLPCSGEACPACIWYARSGLPDLDGRLTNGNGAGIVGLHPGEYMIRVEKEVGDPLFSQRKVHMRAGAMTIARTFPLSQAP